MKYWTPFIGWHSTAKSNKIMLVDCLGERFRITVLEDFFNRGKHDLQCLTALLNNDLFNIKLFHQLGILQYSLDSAPSEWRCAYMQKTSNGFLPQVIQSMLRHFSKVGIRNTMKSSRLYVVESEVDKNVYVDMVKSDLKIINLVLSNKQRQKTIQWILDNDIEDTMPNPFTNSLKHGVL